MADHVFVLAVIGLASSFLDAFNDLLRPYLQEGRGVFCVSLVVVVRC
ncbi:hypothetical protein SynRS9907_02494 [Synechococcus sp. RS9907]|nr:hypothetical protein SynRS9907_02494 [Synechococcus sp. RS9907]